MTSARFRLIEHVPAVERAQKPYVEFLEATADDIWAAIARLDCTDYGGLSIWAASDAWPRLDVLGCETLGYWVSIAHSSTEEATVMPNPDTQGSVEMVTGNQEVDVPLRNLCDSASMSAAVGVFLADQTAAARLPWRRTR